MLYSLALYLWSSPARAWTSVELVILLPQPYLGLYVCTTVPSFLFFCFFPSFLPSFSLPLFYSLNLYQPLLAYRLRVCLERTPGWHLSKFASVKSLPSFILLNHRAELRTLKSRFKVCFPLGITSCCCLPFDLKLLISLLTKYSFFKKKLIHTCTYTVVKYTLHKIDHLNQFFFAASSLLSSDPQVTNHPVALYSFKNSLIPPSPNHSWFSLYSFSDSVSNRRRFLLFLRPFNCLSHLV